MAARCDFFGLKNTSIQKFAREVLVWICGHVAIRRQECGLRAKHQFIPAVPLRREFTQRRSNGALAALEAVIDGRIYYVNAAFHSCDDCLRVTLVGRRIGLTEISSYADGRKHLPARDLAKMPGGGTPLEPRRITKRSLCAGRTGNPSVIVCCWR